MGKLGVMAIFDQLCTSNLLKSKCYRNLSLLTYTGICTVYLHDNPITSMNERILNIHLVTLKIICIDQIAVLNSEKRHNYNNA